MRSLRSPDPHECAAGLGAFSGGFGLLQFEHAAAEDAHGFGAVFVLAFFVLAFNDDAGGEVSDADGAFGFVDFLSTGTTGAHGINLEVFGANVNFNFVGLREHGDSGGAGVDASLSFCFGDSLNAMPATFELKRMKRAVAGYGEDDFTKSAQFGGAEFEDFSFPATLSAVGFVHLVQVTSEECGFVAASTGPNFHDAGTAGDGVAGSGEVFEFDSEGIALGDELLQFGAGVFACFVIGLFVDHHPGSFDVAFECMEAADGERDF